MIVGYKDCPPTRYPSMLVGSRTDGTRHLEKASRLFLAEKLGRPLKPRMDACHTCDNPPCCNPAHLFEGTPKQNAQDMVLKGRHGAGGCQGSHHHRSKLTEESIRQMRRLRGLGASLRSLSILYGVKDNQVSRITNGRAWKHVKEGLV